MKTVKNDLRTCDNIRKIATGQGSDCATACLLDCPYFDLIKQQKLDGDPKAIQQINITGNLNRAEAQPANIGPQDVQRTSRGRSPPASPGRPLKVLSDRPGDVPI